MKAFLFGVSGAVLVLIVASVVYLAYDTHRMAKRGDAAAAFIEAQIQASQRTPK